MKLYELIISNKCVDIYTPHTMPSVLPVPYLFTVTKTLGVGSDLSLPLDGTSIKRSLAKSCVKAFQPLCVRRRIWVWFSLRSLCVVFRPSACPAFSPKAAKQVYFLKQLGYQTGPEQLQVLFKKVKHVSSSVMLPTACASCIAQTRSVASNIKIKLVWGCSSVSSMPMAQDWIPPLKKTK